MNFWDELYAKGKPLVGLSPMDGVTDAPMRYMTARYGARKHQTPNIKFQTKGTEILNSNDQIGGVDIIFTEFVSVDALHFATDERSERLLKTFIKARDIHAQLERGSDTVTQLNSDTAAVPRRWPYEIAQVFGHTPDYFKEAAELIESLGFDGIDINMGCPMHKVEDQGSGAGLIRTPELAKEIVLEVKSATKLPVSVKTRIGVDHDVVEEWMETLMEVEPANISLHGRTLRQLYQGSADWEAIGRAAAVVHKHGGHILGNGDVLNLVDGMAKVEQYGVDGFLIGRAAEGNPGIFLQGSVPCSVCGEQGTEPCMHKRLDWMLEHAKIFEQVFGVGNFMPMRKHLAWYCKGFPGAVEVRSKLMLTNSSEQVEQVVSGIV